MENSENSSNALDPMFELNTQVVQLASTDSVFRHSLLNNPKAAIEELVPEIKEANLNFVVNVVDPHTVYLTIPALFDPEELTDEQLAGVSGGVAFMGITTGMLVAAAAVAAAKATAAAAVGVGVAVATAAAVKATKDAMDKK